MSSPGIILGLNPEELTESKNEDYTFKAENVGGITVVGLSDRPNDSYV